jgi:hypothetical protein
MTQRRDGPGDRPEHTWRAVLPFFVLTGLSVLLQAIVYQARPGAGSYELLSVRRSVENLGRAIIFLVNPFIPPNALNTMLPRTVAATAAAIVALLGLVVWRWGRREGWFLTAWVAATVLPVVLAIIFLAPFRGRYLYIVSIGYILLVVWLVQSYVGAQGASLRMRLAGLRPATTVMLGMVLLGLGSFNAGQQSVVRDDPINALRRWTWGGIIGCPATEGMRARERSWEETDFRRAARGFDQLAQQTQLNAVDILSRGLAYELAGDYAQAATSYQEGLALVPPTGFDTRTIAGGYYASYDAVSTYVQARLAVVGQ